MARKFLYLTAGIIVIIIGALLALRLWSQQLTEIAFVPDVAFTEQAVLEEKAYANPEMWISHPGHKTPDPARWVPEGFTDDSASINAAVFFVHPTTYWDKSHWNAPADDAPSLDRSNLFVKGMASPFNKAEEIWAPRYRQATVGAFLTSKPEGTEALELAYGDVLQAFDVFISTVAANRPIVLAGHSQGSFHLRRLIHERIAGTPLAKRIAVAYLIGWPISLDHDIPVMNLPACAEPDQSGCIVSWLTVAEPADTKMMLNTYARQRGLDGEQLRNSPFLCTNPLTGISIVPAPSDMETSAPTATPISTGTPVSNEAPASANTGTLIPQLREKTGTLTVGKVSARCRDDGFLSIDNAPDLNLGPFVLPDNNYHLFDITLFWGNLRTDFANRLKNKGAAR